MENVTKYKRQYYLPPQVNHDWVKKDYLDHAPLWCSVDLRDGNQALIIPMNVQEKMEYFRLLTEIGFRQIEVAFPGASETDYDFTRYLIDNGMIPEDVTIQVLTQSRDHIIQRTFSAVRNAPRAIVHLYNSTSVPQREQVFRMNRAEVKQIAVHGAQQFVRLAEKTQGNFQFEYTPESFHATEVDYAVEVCNAVLEVWKPSAGNEVIINIPTTVEASMPHVFASQIDYINRNLAFREHVVLSVHPHNDRGTGVASAEMAVLAGADRVEGTLFGNGERTGNVDIVTLALNLYSHGVDPGLELSDLPRIAETYSRLTRMSIPDRQPYIGKLVFTAFSGSHQDAIAKGFAYHSGHPEEPWSVPYLPIDPLDIGREYEGDIIRINSQSGKGGVNYILKTYYGLAVPKAMQEQVGYRMKHVSDVEQAELEPQRIYQIFREEYLDREDVFSLVDVGFRREDGIIADVRLRREGETRTVSAGGKGRLEAVANALKEFTGTPFDLICYEEHALKKGASSEAVSYVGISTEDGIRWGVGIDDDIIFSSVKALASAVNQI